MALSRCKEKKHKPIGRKVVYKEYVEPIGYPNTSTICGRKNCKNAGLLWLTEEEYKLYMLEEEFFSYPSGATRVKVVKINSKK